MRILRLIKPLIIITAIFVMIAPVIIRPAHAATPVWVTNPVLHTESKSGVKTAINTTAQLHQTFYEWAQTFVLETLKKRLLDTIVDQIVAWIQGGDTPKFITNWGEFLTDAGNIAAGDFARGIGASALCSPFSAQIKAAFGGGGTGNFASPITCTLDQIVGNIDSFYSDFRNGGWLAYNESMKPQNNLFAVYIQTQSAQINAIAGAQHAAELEGVANGGYLSTKDCLEPFQGNGNASSLGPDLDGDGKFGDYDCRITTPGSTVGSLLNQAAWVGTGIPGILSAKQLNEYLAAIADSLLSRLIQEGLGGLRNLTTAGASNGSGGGASRCQPYAGAQHSACTGICKNVSGDLLQACVGYASDAQNNLSFAVSNLIGEINQTLTPRQAAQVKLRTALLIEQNLVAYLTSVKTASSFCSAIVQPDIDTASSTAATLAAEITANQLIIDPLETAVANLSGLSIDDWTNYTALANQLPANLDADAAQSLLVDAEIQLNGDGNPFNLGVTEFNTLARARASACH